MKKFILFAVAAIIGIAPVSADAPQEQETKKSQTGDIVLVTTDREGLRDTRSRSISGTPVSAYLDMGQIEVVFDVPEGTATTTIVNALGQAIYQYTCNSEIEWLIYLPLPAEAGNYTLKISTSEAEYEGYFTL